MTRQTARKVSYLLLSMYLVVVFLRSVGGLVAGAGGLWLGAWVARKG